MKCVPCWNDISPRFGLAYDVFGDSRTAIKASVGKFVTAESVNNLAFANLPIVIFQFAMSPYENWQRLAWGGATLITLTVLILNVVASTVFKLKFFSWLIGREIKLNAVGFTERDAASDKPSRYPIAFALHHGAH